MADSDEEAEKGERYCNFFQLHYFSDYLVYSGVPLCSVICNPPSWWRIFQIVWHRHKKQGPSFWSLSNCCLTNSPMCNTRLSHYEGYGSLLWTIDQAHCRLIKYSQTCLPFFECFCKLVDKEKSKLSYWQILRFSSLIWREKRWSKIGGLCKLVAPNIFQTPWLLFQVL
jgi:hypothetical protein